MTLCARNVRRHPSSPSPSPSSRSPSSPSPSSCVTLLLVLTTIFMGVTGSLRNANAESANEAAQDPHIHGHHSHTGKPGYHKSFAGAEEWAKKFDDPARGKWQKPDAVIKALNIQPRDVIADIGAGTGYFSLRIAKSYPEATVYAIDVEPDMVRYLKQQTRKRSLPNHIPLKTPSDRLQLAAKANLVLVVDTYHHIDDRINYFSALRKQLVPGGRVAIIDFTAESPEGPPPKHRMSKADLQTEMSQAGFVLDEDVSLLPYQYFLTFKAATP